MGSGHILIAMFDVLMDIYTSIGYSEREAAFEIVEHNIHGLDIDKRAYQLAYFAVMMKGRGYNRRFFRGRDDVKPMPKVFAIAESNDIPRDHLPLFGRSIEAKQRETAKEQMEYLLDTFMDGREYGSILNVEACDWELLQEYVEDLNMEGQMNSSSDVQGQIALDSYESDVTQSRLRVLVRVAKNLGQKYDAVVTNPPYMGASNMNATLRKFIKDHYADYKSDFFSTFIVKCTNMAKITGYLGFLTPYVWMFIQSYENLRNYLFSKATIEKLIQFEYSAFEEATVPICTFVLKNSYVDKKGAYLRLTDFRGGMEVQRQKTLEAISNLDCGYYYEQYARQYEKIPGNPVAYWVSEKLYSIFSYPPICEFAIPKVGLQTGDNNKFLRLWFEVDLNNELLNATNIETIAASNCKWFPYNKGGEYRKWYGNYEYVVDWKDDGREIKNYKNLDGKLRSRPQNVDFYFKKSITWSFVSSSSFGARYSPKLAIFDVAGSSIFPKLEDVFYLTGLMCSKISTIIMAAQNPTMNFQVGNVAAIPVIFCDKEMINSIAKDNISISTKDWDSFETSWDFQRHPLIPRIRGVWDIDEMKIGTENLPQRLYISASFDSWVNQCDRRFNKLKANEEELNRIFIEIYGLQDELTPEVEDKDVTVRKADLGRDIRSFISYAVGCMFGRYSLDQDGLMLAGQPFESCYFEAAAPRAGIGVAGVPGDDLPTGEFYIKTENGTKKCTYNPDRDNIIPIADEEYFTDDIVGRFVEFVKTVYGKDTLEENLDFIAQALDNKGNSSREVIRNYFIRDFYKDHLKVYQKRPIYWLFDSGKQNGFKALIYMHRYDADTVGRVRIDYLHRAQNYVETAMKSAEYTIENTTVASEKSKAMKAVSKYTKQLAQMQAYDQAIAHVANQRIEIDLDDGVKVNYAKFQGVEVAQEGKKALKVDLLAKLK